MTSIKRLTALVTVVVFMFTLFTFNVYADSTFTDVTGDTQYAEAIQKLYESGIVDGYLAEDGTRTFKPLDTITRGEFAKLLAVAKIKDAAANLTATSSGFSDVDSDPTVSWTIPYIDYAVKASIVNGYEDGTFRAKNTVSYAEAVKMVVCAMGYSSVIEKTEPWYNGYIQVAQQIGILKQAAGSADDAAPRGLVAQLIYNMTISDKVITVIPGGNTGTGSGSGGFVIKDNEKDEDEESVLGMVSAVFNQGVDGETGGSMDEIKLYDDSTGTETTYKIGSYSIDNMYQYLGQYLDITYTVKNSKNTIKSISTDGLNKTVEIDADDIETIDGSYVEYYKDSSTKVSRIPFENNLKIIYNGVGVSGVNSTKIKNLLDIDNGTIKFVDGDDNGKYDTAYVSTYETFFVGTVESTSKTITDKYVKNGNVLKSIKLDMDPENIEFKNSAGTSAQFGSIRQNSVVSIAKPYDTDASYAKTTVIISTTTAQGTVNSISSDDVYEIGNKEYKASNYYKRLVEQDPAQAMNRGDIVTCYLDREGKIVAISSTDTTKYGYIVDVTPSESADKDDVKISMIVAGKSTNSTVAEYTLKKTVRVNGKDGYSPRDIPGVLAESAKVINDGSSNKIETGCEDAAMYSQPIIFKTTSASGTVISSITTVAVGDESDFLEYSKGKTNGSVGLKYADGNSFKDSSNKSVFNMNFSTSSSSTAVSTKVFFVPLDRSEDKDGYTVYSSKPGKFTNGASFYVDAFNVNSNTHNAEIVVVYGGNALEITGNSKTIMIKKISDAVQNGENVKKIVYYDFTASKEVAAEPLYTDGKVDVSDLNPGDIIKYEAKSGAVALVEKIFANGTLYNKAGSDGSQTAADWHISRTRPGSNDSYNAYYGVAYSTDGTLNLVKTSDIEGISTDDPDYVDKISALSPENIGTIGSGIKLFVFDSSAKNEDDKILSYDNIVNAVTPIRTSDGNGNIEDASRVFVSRIGNSIKAIIAYK